MSPSAEARTACPRTARNFPRKPFKMWLRRFGTAPAFLVAVQQIISLLLLTSSLGFAANPKIARDLTAVPGDRQIDVIIRYAHPPQAHHHAAMARRGAILRRQLDLVNSASYSIRASELAALQN